MKEAPSNIPVEELIETFTEIDLRISELHMHSTEVFTRLNGYLKDYHEKITIISKNAARIFKSIAGTSDEGLINELFSLYEEYEKYAKKIREENTSTITGLNRISDYNNFLIFTIKNLKQDFITFKFLFSNYRLISNYKHSEISECHTIEKLDQLITSIHPWLSEIEKEIEKLSVLIGHFIGQLQSYQEVSLHSFSTLAKELRHMNNLVSGKYREANVKLPLLEEKSASSSASISNIITHLQYHDIIRQKIDHIQESHSSLIASLKEKKNSDADMNAMKGMEDIADLSGLQAEQLMLISKEFQNALKVITSNFKIITSDMAEISAISHELSFESDNTEVILLEQVRQQLDEGILTLDKSNISELNERFMDIHQKIRYIYKLLRHSVILPLNRIKKSGEYNLKIVRDPDGTDIIRQISSLLKEILLKNHDLDNYYSKILVMSDDAIRNHRFEAPGSDVEQKQISLMVWISKILDTLDTDIRQLDDILGQNTSLNHDVLEKIDNIVNRFEYHEIFERVLLTIIRKLNSVNQRLKPDSPTGPINHIPDHLKKNESLYTVASERLVYQKVISGDFGPDLSDEEYQSSDDVELF